MNYEIVQLEEKKAVGIKARTNNTSPDMGAVIGGLWGNFYSQGYYEAIDVYKRQALATMRLKTVRH